MSRKLASIQQIAEIQAIPNSDNLAHYRINGWWVVDRINQYQVGDLVIYLEIDSWVPTELAPFLSKGKEPREFNGIKGERLRTIKLRGALSQGLLLSVSVINHAFPIELAIIGTDVTAELSITKWERPIPAQLAGQVRGNFPSFLRKTDQERVQNINLSDYYGQSFEVTEKLDGSSMTIYYNEGQWGVCSRNIDLKLDQEGNAFVDMFNRLLPQLQAGMPDNAPNFAIQGELIGGRIQGNPYNLSDYAFYVFSVYDIDNQEYYLPFVAQSTASHFKLNYVPVIGSVTLLDETTEQLLSLAEGKSLLNLNAEREGIVLKAVANQSSFKCISNKWLMKGND